jgi:acid phosphatase type 7
VKNDDMVLVPRLAAIAAAVLASTAHGEKPPIAYAHADAVAFRAATPAVASTGVWTPPQPGVLTHWGRVEEQLTAPHNDDADDKKPQLIVSTHALEDGEDLVVWWQGVANPHAKDLLALSCGPRVQPHDFLATISVDHTDTTKNSVRFSSLYMMRCNYSVSYMNYDAKRDDYREVATVTVGMKDPFTSPKHGHIALTTEVDEMAVMFNSASARTPLVQYGLSADSLTQQATGNSSTYKASDMCSAPANVVGQVWFRDPGYMHKVILSKLQLGTRYYYRFGNEADGWSDVYSFKSRPSSSVKHAKFLAYADMGIESAPAATSTAVRSFQEIAKGYDDFLLHAGDISYALGHAHLWDEFFHLIEPVATRVPYMVSIGNHEYDYVSGGDHDPSGATGSDGRMAFHPSWANYGADSAGECAVPMVHRWHTPQNGHGIFWYSFDYGGVHVIQMSSEHDWRRGAPQYQWLEKDLQGVDRTKTPWVVLTSHRMMYTTQLGEDADLKVSLHFREEMEELLWKYKVNLMLVGHQHSYERSCAVRHGKCTPDGVGPVHIVVGSAGAGLEKSGFSSDIGEWSVSHINDWGYLRVASTENMMQVQFVLNRNGVVYDQVTLRPWA